jgi:fructose-1,6-bisphosphatase/inositol monophosphatase family enzyme
MKIVNLCAVVIAASVFAIAVEYVYGWAALEPVAEQAGGMVYHWTDGRLGWDAAADSVSVLGGEAGAQSRTN